jgi:hypothetical protein
LAPQRANEIELGREHEGFETSLLIAERTLEERVPAIAATAVSGFVLRPHIEEFVAY